LDDFKAMRKEEWAAIELNAAGCHALESSPEEHQQRPRPFLCNSRILYDPFPQAARKNEIAKFKEFP